MAMGRPTTYKKKFCEMLIKHMSEGYSFQSFAGVDGVDVCIDTLYEWVKVHAEFSDAKKRGTSKSLLKWEKWGVEGIQDEEEYDPITGRLVSRKKINAAVYRMNMINRFGWADSASQADKMASKKQKQEKRLIVNMGDDKNEK